jgi:membrane protein DedA with SNARE-associated domain
MSLHLNTQFTQLMTTYGYLALFLLVFAQELGVPNPVTNEFVLLYAGYMAFSGVLNLWLVLLTAMSADCIGTTLLYLVFYLFQERLLRRRPRWFLRPEQFDRVSRTLSERQRWGIYAGRLVPFLRGYVSVAAGVLSIGPAVFLPAVLVSAITWSGGFVIAGALMRPYWEHAAAKVGDLQTGALLAGVLLASTLIGRAIVKPRTTP